MESENRNVRAIPELSVDSQVLIRRLQLVKIGEIITYEELTREIKRDVQGVARGNMTTARHRTQEDDGIVFGTIPTVGLKRLDDIGIVSTGTHDVKRIHNISMRAGKRLAHVRNFEALPIEKQKEHLLFTAEFGVLAHFGKAKTQEKLVAGTDPKKLMPSTEMLRRIQETL